MQTFIYISRQHIHAQQNSWHGHTTLHTLHHKHATLRCERTLTLWHSYTDNHRGQVIENDISSSDHRPLNTNTPNQSAKHHTIIRKPTGHNSRKTQESIFAQTTIPTSMPTANIMFTNIILMADKHNIPKGKMHSNCRLLPDHIVCTITQINNIRRANTCDPALKLFNEETYKNITKPMEGTLRCTLGSQAPQAHYLEDHTRSIQRAPPPTLNTSITFNNKIATTPKHIANCFTKQFTNTVKHATHKTSRSINRATHKTYNTRI